MKILLLERGPITHKVAEVNGTRTMILRMAKQLMKDGHVCYFVKFNENSLGVLDAIEQYAEIIRFKDFWSREALRRMPSLDAIHCFTTDTFLIGAWMKRRAFPEAALVAGFYHPRQYHIDTYGGFNWLKHLYERIFSSIPAGNLVFMDEAVRKAHERLFSRDFSKTPLLPLPVEVPESHEVRTGATRTSVVSIGRLVNFKKYPLGIIDAVVELKREGYDFEFQIYGDGPLRGEIERKIQEQQLGQHVRLNGEIDYSRFGEVLKDAGLFVGMGTSLVEAAGRSVPSLVAIESEDQPVTYGLFHRTGNHEIGEKLEGQSVIPMTSSLRSIAQLMPDEYQLECRLSHEHAKYFAIDSVMARYYKIVESCDRRFCPRITAPMILPWAVSRAQERFLSKEHTRHK